MKASELRSRLYDAIYWEQDVRAVRVLLDAHPDFDLDTRLHTGRTALSWACAEPRKKTVAIIELLLERGASVNIPRGKLPLHTVAYHGSARQSEPIVRLLLAHGADLEARQDGLTPIDIAAGRWKDWAASFAKIAFEHTRPTTRTLDMALQRGTWNIVKLVAAHGVDLDRRDKHGRTALHRVVASYCRYEGRESRAYQDGADDLLCGGVDALLAAGADRTVEDAKGRTPHALASSIERFPRAVLAKLSISTRGRRRRASTASSGRRSR